MNVEYYSEAELRHAERLRRRQRLVSGVRGWLYEKRSPRLRALVFLTASLATGTGLAWLLRLLGLRSLPTLVFLGTLTAWPVFLLLIRREGQRLLGEFDDAASMQHYLARDESMLRQEFFPVTSPGSTNYREVFWRTFGRESGKLPLPILLTLGAATLGLWLLWDLLRLGPTLFAEALVDDAFPRCHPQIAEPVHTEPWLINFLGSTAIHFGGFACCASFVILNTLLYPLPPGR